MTMSHVCKMCPQNRYDSSTPLFAHMRTRHIVLISARKAAPHKTTACPCAPPLASLRAATIDHHSVRPTTQLPDPLPNARRRTAASRIELNALCGNAHRLPSARIRPPTSRRIRSDPCNRHQRLGGSYSGCDTLCPLLRSFARALKAFNEPQSLAHHLAAFEFISSASW